VLFAEKRNVAAEKWCAAVSSQGKYILSKLTHTVCYEVQQACGGITVTDNTPIDEFMDTSKIEEVTNLIFNLLASNRWRSKYPALYYSKLAKTIQRPVLICIN